VQLLLIDGLEQGLVNSPGLRTILVRVEIVVQAQLIIKLKLYFHVGSIHLSHGWASRESDSNLMRRYLFDYFLLLSEDSLLVGQWRSLPRVLPLLIQECLLLSFLLGRINEHGRLLPELFDLFLLLDLLASLE
jgi:hypothetical protein